MPFLHAPRSVGYQRSMPHHHWIVFMIDTVPPVTPKSGIRRSNALWSGCMLDEYRIDAILGAGGFGVTYKAWDTLLETWVAIKEYFPVEWSFRDADGVTVHANTQGGDIGDGDGVSDYLWGLERFLDEARVLARIQHPFVVRVKRYFRAHGTAYIVMDYEEGEPLNAVLQDGETLGEAEVRGLLEDVLPALQAVHEQGFLHRDLKPSNLYVRASDHRVILIDFGAAREAIGRHSKSVTSLVTPGYSPPEQYTTRNDRYGTWTDVYALGAVLYRCVTGRPPTEAAERLLEDTLEPAVRAGAGRYSADLLRVIDRALAVRPERRFATVAELQAALDRAREPDENSDSGSDSDETVILGPLLKPGGRPVLEPAMLRPIKLSMVPVAKPVTDGGDLNILPPLDESHRSADQRLDGLRSQPVAVATRREFFLPTLVGGGLTPAVLAAVVLIWLWPSTPAPEEKLPPRYDLGQRQQSVAISDSNSPTIARPPVAVAMPPTVPVSDSTVSGPTSEPPPVPIKPVAPPLATPALPLEAPGEASVVKMGITGSSPATPSGQPADLVGTAGVGSEPVPESIDPTTQPVPVKLPASERAPESVAETTDKVLAPGVAPAVKSPAGATAKLATQGSTAGKTGARPVDAATIRSRIARRQAGRRSAEPRLGDIGSESPAREKQASRMTVGNPWESPASTGFNQK